MMNRVTHEGCSGGPVFYKEPKLPDSNWKGQRSSGERADVSCLDSHEYQHHRVWICGGEVWDYAAGIFACPGSHRARERRVSGYRRWIYSDGNFYGAGGLVSVPVNHAAYRDGGFQAGGGDCYGFDGSCCGIRDYFGGVFDLYGAGALMTPQQGTGRCALWAGSGDLRGG